MFTWSTAYAARPCMNTALSFKWCIHYFWMHIQPKRFLKCKFCLATLFAILIHFLNAWINHSINFLFFEKIQKKIKIKNRTSRNKSCERHLQKIVRDQNTNKVLAIERQSGVALRYHAKICWLFSIYHHRQLLSLHSLSYTQSHISHAKSYCSFGSENQTNRRKTKINIKRNAKKKIDMKILAACASFSHLLMRGFRKLKFASFILCWFVSK